MASVRHIWSVLCARSVIDRDTNNISLFEVLEQLHVEPLDDAKKTAIRLPLVVEWVTLWTRMEDNKPSVDHGKDTVLSPSGRVLLEREYEVDVSKKKRTRLTRRLAGLPLPESGKYRFLTQLKDGDQETWQVVSDVPLEISIKKAPARSRSRRSGL